MHLESKHALYSNIAISRAHVLLFCNQLRQIQSIAVKLSVSCFECYSYSECTVSRNCFRYIT